MLISIAKQLFIIRVKYILNKYIYIKLTSQLNECNIPIFLLLIIFLKNTNNKNNQYGDFQKKKKIEQ